MNNVYNAVNKPLLMFGVERPVFVGALLSAICIFYMIGLIAAIVIVGLIFTAARMATRDDPKMAQVIVAATKLSRLYDSAERK